jgi:hypothetical protein
MEGSSMKKWGRFLIIPALLIGLVTAVAPASADHKSNPVWVTCDPSTGKITVTLSVFGDGADNSNEIDFIIGGVWASEYLDFGYGIAPGTYVKSIVIPAAAQYGIEVIATDGGNEVSTLCGVMESAPIPAGFVLHWLTCNTPVYNTPAGSQVGQSAVTTGQTWYINPKPVSAGDGSSWTEIFVAGLLNGYVPTSCIGSRVN